MQFTPIKVDWYANTFIFYLSLILLCYFIAIVERKKVLVFGTIANYRKELWLILISAILIFVKGFGTTGRDLRSGYFLCFLSATSMKDFRDQSVEIGYRLLNVIVRNITDEYWVFVLVCSLITVLPVMHMLKKYADKIDLPIAVLLYVTCYFFNCFSPMRQAMSASLLLFAFDAMVEHKYGKAFILVLIASIFHISALVFVLPLLFSSAKLMSKRLLGFCLVGMFIVIYISRTNLISLFSSGNSRYEIYNAFDSVKFGFQQPVYYIPLFLIFYFGRKLETNKNFERISFSFLSTGFLFGMLGYVIGIFGRFDILFVPFVIIISHYCMLIKKHYPKYRIIINLAMIVYCIARFIIFITDYYNSQDLMPYTNIFGWVV